jgi:hypothetical protein
VEPQDFINSKKQTERCAVNVNATSRRALKMTINLADGGDIAQDKR